MKQLKTIEGIHRQFDGTGMKPLLVTCDDLQDWVCKYHRFPSTLLKEYIGSAFAKYWGIKTPDTSFIQVLEEHIDLNQYQGLQLNWFRHDCFGSLFLNHADLITNATLPLFKNNSFRAKIKNKTDFLWIALFDIWTANEDRNHNNYNLLLNSDQNSSYFFYTIDHETLFNSSLLERELTEITEEETIINTDIALILFRSKNKTKQIVEVLIQNFYLCTRQCEEELHTIIPFIPVSWNIDTVQFVNRMKQHLFSDEWKKKCELIFRTYVQTFLIN